MSATFALSRTLLPVSLTIDDDGVVFVAAFDPAREASPRDRAPRPLPRATATGRIEASSSSTSTSSSSLAPAAVRFP